MATSPLSPTLSLTLSLTPLPSPSSSLTPLTHPLPHPSRQDGHITTKELVAFFGETAKKGDAVRTATYWLKEMDGYGDNSGYITIVRDDWIALRDSVICQLKPAHPHPLTHTHSLTHTRSPTHSLTTPAHPHALSHRTLSRTRTL